MIQAPVLADPRADSGYASTLDTNAPEGIGNEVRDIPLSRQFTSQLGRGRDIRASCQPPFESG
jgi:hypothetical protein